MARLFILLLIALLPLRGWTAQGTVLAMPADCPMQMQAAKGQPASASHGTDHRACESCQLCMPLASALAPVLLTLADALQMLPEAHTSRFASADLALGVKPPIS